MRILAIRGENLASFAAPFEIDLASEPLAGTGLFAITGETGAGKSTILDALCLALYGEYPRVAISRNEKTRDASGEAIGVSDARAILRRGAGRGFAEADFIGQDGHGYRARWDLSRSRGKAVGRLQNEQRSLCRLDDSSAVASGKTPVRAAVEERTGLNFEQFRRTVLLAQGEFDGFLMAAEKERAELLEKITGTGVYAEISRLVHVRTDEHRARVKALEMERDGLGLLDAAARRELEAEQAAIAEDGAAKTRELEAAQARIKHAEQLASARQNLLAVQQEIERAAQDDHKAQGDRDYLAQLNAAEPLRARFMAIAKAEQQCKLAEDEERAAASAAEALGRDAAKAGVALQQADEAYRFADRALQEFTPVWSAAEQLDAKIEQAGKEFANAQAQLVEARTGKDNSEHLLRTLEQEQVAKGAQHAIAERELADAQAHAPLADRGEDIARHLAKRRELREQLAVDRQALEKQSSDARTLADSIGRLEKQIGECQAQRAHTEREASSRLDALAALDEAGLRARDSALSALLEPMRDMVQICERFNDAVERLAHADQEAREASQRLHEASDKLERARADKLRHESARDEVHALAELAEGAVSKQAAQLRSLLVAGRECPVCGSRDHGNAHAPDHLTDIANQMRRRRAEIADALRQTDAVIAAAQGEIAQAQGLSQDAVRRHEAGAGDKAKSLAAYQTLHPQLDETCRQCGIAFDLVLALDASTHDAAIALSSRIAAERMALAEPLRQTQELRGEIDRLRAAYDQSTKSIESDGLELARLRQEHQGKRIAITEASRSLADNQERIDSIDREHSALYVCAELSPGDFDRDAVGSASKLRLLGEAFRKLRERTAELDQELREIAPKLAGARSAHGAAIEQQQKLEGVFASRQEELARLTSDRAGLLGGEPTAAHRQRTSTARQAAFEQREAANGHFTKVGNDLAAVKSKLETAAKTRADSHSAAAFAQIDFDEACKAAGLAPVDAQALLLVALEERHRLRSHLEKLAHQLMDLRAKLAARQNDLDTLIASGGEGADVAELNQYAAELRDAIGTMRERWGEIRGQLRNDDELKQKAGRIELAIGEAKRALSVWQAVDNAIGSADGSRFRKFAQAITLDHLVALANKHLDVLSPRYRLARAAESDLALQVADREMEDNIRSTRSLSGGERFLVSLALALALAGLEGRQSFVDTLFIDEGFGSLDSDTLDVAIDALETLQSSGRKVGVITHVAAMIERIAVQVRVEKQGSGRSVVRVVNGHNY